MRSAVITRVVFIMALGMFVAAAQRDNIHIGRGEGIGRGQGRGQGHGCQMPTLDAHLNYLSEKLNLSPDQRAKLTASPNDQLSQMQTIRNTPSLSPEDAVGRV